MEPNNIQNFFPVYDMLLEQVKSMPNSDTSLNANDINELKSKIDKIDKLGKDMIYVIVRIHSLRFSDSKLLDLPYGGEKMSTKIENNDVLSDIKFDVRQFPNVLSRILIVFCNLHLRRIKEDSDKLKVNL